MMWTFGILFFSLIAFGSSQTVKTNIEYGESCNITSPCLASDKQDPLQCGSGGVCECPPDLFRHSSLNRCVSPPGGACTIRSKDGLPIQTCTEFATCWSNDMVDPALPRQNGTCFCEPDAKADNHTGLCKLAYGSVRCSKLGDCDVNSLLTCRYNSCACQDDRYQIYNRTLGKCEALVGGTCGQATQPPFPAPTCHEENMKCVEGKCACVDGHAQNFEKKCSKLTATTQICQGGSPFIFGGGFGGGGGEAFDDGFIGMQAMGTAELPPGPVAMDPAQTQVKRNAIRRLGSYRRKV